MLETDAPFMRPDDRWLPAGRTEDWLRRQNEACVLPGVCRAVASCMDAWTPGAVAAATTAAALRFFRLSADVVLAGSSILARWRCSGADFAPLSVCNVAEGGATSGAVVDSQLPSVRRTPPRCVLYYAGSNDVNQWREAAAAKVRRSAAAFADGVGDAWLVVIGVMNAPQKRKEGLEEAVRAVNEELRQMCEAGARRVFVDVDAALSGESYLPDGLHLTAAGYRCLRAALLPVVRNCCGLPLDAPALPTAALAAPAAAAAPTAAAAAPARAGPGDVYVGNLRTRRGEPCRDGQAVVDVVCDRSSLLGNPFPMARDGDDAERQAVCAAFAEYLDTVLSGTAADRTTADVCADIVQRRGLRQLDPGRGRYPCPFLRAGPSAVAAEVDRLRRLVAEGQSLRLMCHCHPLLCHTTVIRSHLRPAVTAPPPGGPLATDRGARAGDGGKRRAKRRLQQ
eukprot:TRINITY_DN2864_c0_g1_i1.p2 TRINITY_DN2864_c0_g1~~TRINITY_DN2864_c0_g1_i1.p2  ORF type:complete len:452 (+),score=147.64 TRINITY_DN2864_c0_g1_i1:803-2158(+)